MIVSFFSLFLTLFYVISAYQKLTASHIDIELDYCKWVGMVEFNRSALISFDLTLTWINLNWFRHIMDITGDGYLFDLRFAPQTTQAVPYIEMTSYGCRTPTGHLPFSYTQSDIDDTKHYDIWFDQNSIAVWINNVVITDRNASDCSKPHRTHTSATMCFAKGRWETSRYSYIENFVYETSDYIEKPHSASSLSTSSPSTSSDTTAISTTSSPSNTNTNSDTTAISTTSSPSNTNTNSGSTDSASKTNSSLNGSCLNDGLTKNLYWGNISNSLPEYDFNINVDQTNSGINIELVTDYLGDSYDENNNPVGTSYILDFVQFHSYNHIENPGSCSNRLASSYINKTFAEYWRYSANPSDANQLGNINYLAYGPLPSQWKLTAESYCTKVRYTGNFTFDELRNCVDYDGNKLVIINADNDWINMTGRFYVSVISPITMSADVGYYIEDLIVSDRFEISIQKSIDILNNIDINVFLVTIFQSQRTFTHRSDDNGYIIILSSQTVNHLQLINPNLLTYPSQYNTWSVNSFNGLNESCYINTHDICVQFWVIEINNLTCPLSFDGIFQIEWTAECNPNIDNTECNSYLNNYGNQIALSINMDYTDQFQCDMVNQAKLKYNGILNFYQTSSFLCIDNNISYQTNMDTVYIEIEITDLLSELTANLLNVWICSTQNTDYILEIVPDNEINSGCFDSLKINPNTFNAIIFNRIELLYNAKIYDTSSIANNIIRFSFVTPDFVGVDTLYIHSEIELTLNNGSARTRMLLTKKSDSVYDFVHLSNNIKIQSKSEQEPEKKTLTKPRIYIEIIVVSSFLICVVVLAVIYTSVNKCKRKYNVMQKHAIVAQAQNNSHNISEGEFGDVFIETNQHVNEGEFDDVINDINLTLQHIGNHQDGEMETGYIDVNMNLFGDTMEDIGLNQDDDAIEMGYID